MPRSSIFDLLQPAETPSTQDLRRWLGNVFPKMADRASFQLASQLEKLFEMSVFENQVDAVHLLLQQGIPANIRFDWGMTPLMWANYLGYTKIANLLIAYGANQHTKSFHGTRACDFVGLPLKNPSIECETILKRRAEIHDQVIAGYLKPLVPPTTSSSGTSGNKKPKIHRRQIDNGRGIDEIFKATQSRKRPRLKPSSNAKS